LVLVLVWFSFWKSLDCFSFLLLVSVIEFDFIFVFFFGLVFGFGDCIGFRFRLLFVSFLVWI
jgi:hypothetical protein